jgi:hypothetical protein
MKLKRLVTATLLLAPITAWSATGNSLRDWGSGYEQNGNTFADGVYLGYVAGVVDVLSGIAFCPPKGMTNGQGASVVWKWLSANPERWSEPGGDLVIAALNRAYPCKK